MAAGEQLIDQRVALWAAQVVAPTRDTHADEVTSLRIAVRDDLPVVDRAARAWSRLGTDLGPTRCRVLGRLGWVRANLAALDGAFDPLADRLQTSVAVASRVIGAQIGALLGLLSSKVLGQYVLPLAGGGTGHLVVVGPNLLDLAEEHGALAADIRRTVMLHEVTHRLQFESVGWLADHLRGLIRRYLEHANLDSSALLGAVGRIPEALARVRETGSITPLMQAVLSPEQAAVIDEAQSVMSLLEGHGNAAMTLGADGVVADPEGVRDALERRRTDATTRILTAVAGLDLKRRQYREGEVFVREVVEEAGVEALNRAFTSPNTLPSPEEIATPSSWLDRVGR